MSQDTGSLWSCAWSRHGDPTLTMSILTHEMTTGVNFLITGTGTGSWVDPETASQLKKLNLELVLGVTNIMTGQCIFSKSLQGSFRIIINVENPSEKTISFEIEACINCI